MAPLAVVAEAPERDVDPDVARRLCAGDREALGSIYDRFHRPVWAVAMHVLGDRHLAEDAMHETFLRLWRSADAFDPTRPLGPWLFTIARRTALDVHRREFRPTRGDHEAETDVVVWLPDLEQAWETWEVQMALTDLPADEQTVVRLSHYEEMTHSEIADLLAVPVGTVKSRSHRAHRRLAARLRHLRDDGGGDV